MTTTNQTVSQATSQSTPQSVPVCLVCGLGADQAQIKSSVRRLQNPHDGQRMRKSMGCSEVEEAEKTVPTTSSPRRCVAYTPAPGERIAFVQPFVKTWQTQSQEVLHQTSAPSKRVISTQPQDEEMNHVSHTR